MIVMMTDPGMRASSECVCVPGAGHFTYVFLFTFLRASQGRFDYYTIVQVRKLGPREFECLKSPS